MKFRNRTMGTITWSVHNQFFFRKKIKKTIDTSNLCRATNRKHYFMSMISSVRNVWFHRCMHLVQGETSPFLIVILELNIQLGGNSWKACAPLRRLAKNVKSKNASAFLFANNIKHLCNWCFFGILIMRLLEDESCFFIATGDGLIG